MRKRSEEVTSKIMSAIKSRDTRPEIFFRKALWKWGIRYRKNVKKGKNTRGDSHSFHKPKNLRQQKRF